MILCIIHAVSLHSLANGPIGWHTAWRAVGFKHCQYLRLPCQMTVLYAWDPRRTPPKIPQMYQEQDHDGAFGRRRPPVMMLQLRNKP